jgi:adenylate cyclase
MGALEVEVEKVKKKDPEFIQKVWHAYLNNGDLPDDIEKPWWTTKRYRKFFRHLPSSPRCTSCYYPFEGLGGSIMRTVFRVQPSRMNPNLCNMCEQFAEDYQGGAEVEITILFADIRGSTQLAEKMNPTEFSQLINRFYNTTTSILFDHGAMVEKIAGDAITAFFTRGFAGEKHAQVAVETAREIIQATGHHDTDDPWAPLGIGIHTGLAYVGSVRSDTGANEITVLGDTANIGARLCSLAGVGEIYISQATAQAARLDGSGVKIRQLVLKGRSDPVETWII